MLPAQPPLPTAWSLPFHPEVGSQTSILMSESLVGFSVAATRQNGGRLAYGDACAPPRPGVIKPPAAAAVPAATVCAVVIVAFGSASFASDSHEAGPAAAVWTGTVGTNAPISNAPASAPTAPPEARQPRMDSRRFMAP